MINKCSLFVITLQRYYAVKVEWCFNGDLGVIKRK
jgi:hypothetical protein